MSEFVLCQRPENTIPDHGDVENLPLASLEGMVNEQVTHGGGSYFFRLAADDVTTFIVVKLAEGPVTITLIAGNERHQLRSGDSVVISRQPYIITAEKPFVLTTCRVYHKLLV